jgi:hypothetical protein
MRFLLLVVPMLFCAGALLAQEEEAPKEPEYGWMNDVVFNFSFTQNNFDNWNQGGDNSWSWQTDLLPKFIYKQEKYDWENIGKFSYGKTKVGDQNARKAADEIMLESSYTYKMGTHVNPYVAVKAQTQFTAGYEYTDTSMTEISNFMDPGYFTESVGAGWSPNDQFRTRLGAAYKQTVTDKFADRYAKGDKFRTEFGMESVTDVELKFHENISYTGRLSFFSNLKRFDEIDTDWDNLIKGKLTDIINVTFSFRLFYDRDVSAKRQLKQTLAVGVSFDLL